MPIPLAIPLIAGAAKGVMGLSQLLGNKKPRERPDYQIPAEVKQALALQEGMATQREFFQPEREQLQAATAANVGAMKEASGASDILGAIGQAYQGQTGRQREYDVANLRERMAQKQRLQGMLGEMGQFKEKQWELNVNLPWKRQMQEWAEKRSTGFENLFAGIGDVAGTAMVGQSNQEMMQFYRDLYGLDGQEPGVGGAAGAIGQVGGAATRAIGGGGTPWDAIGESAEMQTAERNIFDQMNMGRTQGF